MSGIDRGAVLKCPSCRGEVDCYWPEDRFRARQHCPSCGRSWTAKWPGFDLKAETVVIDSSGRVADDPR